MKKQIFNKSMKLTWLFLLALVTIVSSCDDDDNDEPAPVLTEDGIYVVGAGTALTELDAKGLMKVTRNEVNQKNRSALSEIYIAVKAGADGFNIVKVSGSTKTVYGPGADFAKVADADLNNEEPKDGLWKGTYSENESKFTVPEDGLYHVVIDTELGKVVIARVKWGVIGGATPGSWSNSTVLEAGAFDLNKISFETTGIIMIASDYKFRYSDGWKIILDTTYDAGVDDSGNPLLGIRVNTNLGGSLDALVPGGDNIVNSEPGVYTINVTWELGVGTSATLTKTGDYTPPAYPDAMYIVGDATAYGWDAPGTSDAALMHKVAGGATGEGIFWKICYIEEGKGFKLAAKDWGDPNLGFAEVDEFDADGVIVSDNGGNMSVPTSGMYMVVVNLRDDKAKVSVTAPTVYGIGDPFGGWDVNVSANLFTVDNTAKTLTSPALTADGSIRMYAAHTWIPDWWNAEFNVYNGVIEYRNDGGDQEAVAGTAGQVITLTFDNNTGAIN